MDVQECGKEEICEHCSELELENTELKRQILDLKEVKQLEASKITMYEDGKYTDDVRII